MHDDPPSDALAPSRLRFLAEAGVAFDWLKLFLGRSPRLDPNRGKGRVVLAIPGFLADDLLTAPLRRTLARAGYEAHGWALGQNRGVEPDTLERIEARIADIGNGRPVALVGWSLGGLYAREIAKRRPALVERGVTLGTPFSGDLRANHAWRLYERVAGHPVDAPPIALHPASRPPVPTIALWSRRDGIVAPASARGLPGETDLAIEVDCLHMGFTVSRAAIAAVLDALDVTPPLRTP